MKNRPEFLIGATRSGSGKTLLTLGILAALSRRGLDVQPFKCGPDFIDPTLHRLAVSRNSINLDLHMMGEAGCRRSFERYGRSADAVVIEGVMGLFDGGKSSSSALANLLGVGVLLIIDVRSAAESIAAVVKGFETYNPATRIIGIVCNRVGSDRHRQLIEEAITASCATPVLGFFPRDEDFELESRHLGLHMGHEVRYADSRLDKLVNSVERHIDIDNLLKLSEKESASPLPGKKTEKQKQEVPRLRLAVASDKAFCFYYEENFAIMKSCGFEMVPFSPLHDSRLPEDICGIYLGGGYPELYAEELSGNKAMLNEIRAWAESGRFVYGECGGFMYLTRELIDHDGDKHEMSGIFDVSVQMKKRLTRLGYRAPMLHADSLLGRKNAQVFGHEFHYSDIVERADNLEYLYVFEDGRLEGCRKGNAFGSYVHLHFARTVGLIEKMHESLR